MALSLLLVTGLFAAEAPLAAPSIETINELRAARREAMRGAIRAKTGWPVAFGLLVIPIDFADARFDPSFDPSRDLLPRLEGDEAGSLKHYFLVASRGRTVLDVRLAPVVSLPGDRLDYSDLYLQGLSRSRAMATQALARAAALGVDFASSDLDRNGEVDGVLLLHAAPGLENDLEGLIVPLQYFIDPPVVQRGVLARSYAVASARSMLGIWAHETGHLLGLEDRYDHAFPANAEEAPRGGLGRFSLMASGWLGSGAGVDPALPDGYSCLLLGWVDLAESPGPAAVVRLDFQSGHGPEFFIAEQRFPALTAPYDAMLPDQRLLLLHIDEMLAEGQVSSADWSTRHLRANLVQADGTRSVALGHSQGAATDLFPRDGAWQVFNDQSIPSSRSYSGQPTGVDVTVAVLDGALQFASQSTIFTSDLRLSFVAEHGAVRPQISVKILTGRAVTPTLQVAITCVDTLWGRFESGRTLTAQLVAREPGADGWADYLDDGLERWIPAASLPQDAVTVFLYAIEGDGAGPGHLIWPWNPLAADLDLQGPWLDRWHAEYPTGDLGTRWHRWVDGPSAEGIMLACAASDAPSAAAWPDIRYGNRAHAVLLSPVLGEDIDWVELTHAVDLELDYQGRAVDGVTLRWVHANGRVVIPATPADGWLGRVDTKARHPLAGQPTFAVADALIVPENRPLWRREILPLPQPALNGPGPWRLRLELASDGQWAGRGWLVRDVAGHAGQLPASAFALSVMGDELQWNWTGGGDVDAFDVESSRDGGRTWRIEAPGIAGGATGRLPLIALGLTPGQRIWLRVLARQAEETIASRALLLSGARVPSLGPPVPNPVRSLTHLAVDGAGDAGAAVGLHDLRGRLLRRWNTGSGASVLSWDGRDEAGRRMPAGVYVLRLRAAGEVATRKVTLIP